MSHDTVSFIALCTGLLVFLLVVSVVSKNYSLNRIKSKTVGDGQHGTARWATLKEIGKTYAHILRLLLAVVFGGIIGTERGKHGRAAGMRTHILVCIGATMTTLIGEYVTFVLGMSSDPVRIGAQVISGIGFLGAGMIMTRGGLRVKGLTTAAGLWATATIGLALGIGLYSAAIIAVFLVYTTNKVLPIFEKNTRIDTRYIYEEINDVTAVTDYIRYVKEEYQISSVYIVPAKSGISGHIGIEMELPLHAGQKIDETCTAIASDERVSFAVELCEQ